MLATIIHQLSNCDTWLHNMLNKNMPVSWSAFSCGLLDSVLCDFIRCLQFTRKLMSSAVPKTHFPRNNFHCDFLLHKVFLLHKLVSYLSLPSLQKQIIKSCLSNCNLNIASTSWSVSKSCITKTFYAVTPLVYLNIIASYTIHSFTNLIARLDSGHRFIPQ